MRTYAFVQAAQTLGGAGGLYARGAGHYGHRRQPGAGAAHRGRQQQCAVRKPVDRNRRRQLDQPPKLGRRDGLGYCGHLCADPIGANF